MRLIGGYVIDEVFKLIYDQVKFESYEKAILHYSKLCHFNLEGIHESFKVNLQDGIESSVLLVAFNIINRGNPTRASLLLTKKVLYPYGYEINENLNGLGNVIFKKEDGALFTININSLELNSLLSDSDLFNCILAPIYIAQIQKATLLLFLSQKARYSKEFNIHCNKDRKIKNCFELAFDDLYELIANLYKLSGLNFKKPKISFTDKEDSDLSLGINEEGYDFQIKSQNANEGEDNFGNNEEVDDNIFDIVLTSKKIKYSAIGRYKTPKEFVPFKEKHNVLLYFLNNLFRKKTFRPGQLGIINRVLQGKDVIGILPTGSGKSLTYQLSSLLQPGICIVVDPIRSLMKDQYDKLVENFINKVQYINSNDDKDQRQKKEEEIAKGKYQFVIVGPERLQIQEFRNYLNEFKNNNLRFSYLVIDEAHCISEWGHDFRYSYLRLSDIVLKNCFDGQTDEFVQIALTATASFDVMSDIQREIKVGADSLLHPPDPDRKELHFEVVTFEPFNPNNIVFDKLKQDDNGHIIKDGRYDYWKERYLAEVKYHKLKELLRKDLPLKISELNNTEQSIKSDYLSIDNFWQPTFDNSFPNAGIIYCPTKSDSKGNGAYAVCYNLYAQKSDTIILKGLDSENTYLNKGTYFGGDNDNVWENKRVNDEAKKANENQDKFMRNKLNLIVATKAFGMGLDKPNVRFTIHYSLPTSIESFYQEAGRAGRDGTHSLNYIMYSPSDLETNLDNIKNAHKGVHREYITYNELLTEIKYEDWFYLNILNAKFQEKYPYYNLRKWENAEGYYYIFINDGRVGGFENNEIANVYLGNNRIYTNNSIIEQNEAEKVGKHLLKLLDQLSNGQNYVDFLSKKSNEGIETILNNGDIDIEYKLLIGFNNEIVEHLGRKVGDREMLNDEGKTIKIKGARVVRSAYNFCDGEDNESVENQFIENLKYQYYRDEPNPPVHKLTIIDEEFKKAFWHIRISTDTNRAIYRLNVLGVIEDYTIDYSNKYIEITFKKQEQGYYYKKLEQYLLRYVGKTKAKEIVEQSRIRNSIYDSTELRQCLNELTDFYAKAITEKRIHSAHYVAEAINDFIENGQDSFRQKINNYFASKYAQSFYEDFIINSEVDYLLIEKYLKLIKTPEFNNPGLEIDNLKHLIGSCERYEVDSTKNDNYVVFLLKNAAQLVISQRDQKLESVVECTNNIVFELERIKDQNLLNEDKVKQILNWIEYYSANLEPETRNFFKDIKDIITLKNLKKNLEKIKKTFLNYG